MASRAKYPDPSLGWQPYQVLITRLYRDEGLSLKQVMRIMQSRYGFKATEKMYKSRFKAWGLDKNNKCTEVREILQQRAIRKSLGKKSEFKLRGRPVDIADLERYAKRKGLTLTPTAACSTKLTQDLICFTPPSTPPTIDPPTSFRHVEEFLLFYNAFLEDSLQSGFWRLDKNFWGIACIHSPGHPRIDRHEFSWSIKIGVQRYKLGVQRDKLEDITQAYGQWRQAFSQLQFMVSSKLRT